MSETSNGGSVSIAFKGKIGEVVHETQPDGRVFERYRRPPGTRLIIISPENKILITKEHRKETGNIDLRLPGGKVRDSLEEYHSLLESSQDMQEAAKEAAKKEALEETGHELHDLEFVTKATAGATVEWDLYYFIARDYSESADGQQLEHGEEIEVTWMSTEEIRSAISRGDMQEWRSVGVLLGYVFPKIENM